MTNSKLLKHDVNFPIFQNSWKSGITFTLNYKSQTENGNLVSHNKRIIQCYTFPDTFKIGFWYKEVGPENQVIPQKE